MMPLVISLFCWYSTLIKCVKTVKTTVCVMATSKNHNVFQVLPCLHKSAEFYKVSFLVHTTFKIITEKFVLKY